MAMEPGWYPDPFSSGGYVRWWDGERWGASTSVGTTAPTSSTPGAPVPLPPPPPAAPAYPPMAYGAVPQGAAPLPLASWVSRAMAWLLDSFVQGVLALPFTAWLVWPAMERLIDSASSGSALPASDAIAAFQRDVLSASTAILVVSVVVSFLYTVPQNKKWGRTLGKRALGIRIRPKSEDTGLSWGQVLMRWLVFEGLSVLSGLLLLIDCLWPLWDKPWQQALHDKAASTIVVPGR